MSQIGSRKKDEFRTAVTSTVLWVAGMTLSTLFLALFGGLWLDKLFSTKHLLTIIFILVSIPITLLLTIIIVRTTTAKINPANINDVEEKINSDKQSKK